MNVDTAGNTFCLFGQVIGIDPTTTFNRQVTFTYSSVGSIKKATAKTVTGEFVAVDLTITIDELTNPPTLEFTDTVTTGCKLKGRLKKEGDAAKVTLRCDIGEDLSAFTGLAAETPEDQQAFLENVVDAFPKRKNLKVSVKKGKLSFNHRGEPAGPGVDVPTGSCGGNGIPE
jgi:hypothetical protein